MYPEVTNFHVVLGENRLSISLKAQSPAKIEEVYSARYKRSISHFEDPLSYRPNFADNVAYLKVGSFYKGFIESFGKRYEPYIDSVFKDLHHRKVPNLVLDLRDNEGGGDHYDAFLYSHLSTRPFRSLGPLHVPAKSFQFAKYTVNLTEDLKAYIANPSAFLRDDTSLFLKPEFSDEAPVIKPSVPVQKRNIYVLTNGGSFSAANILIKNLYDLRNTTNSSIYFIGEENGGDIYSNVQCAGQGYIIRLPNSGITVSMPFLCSGKLNKVYPKKPLPDHRIYPTMRGILDGTDAVLQFTLQRIRKRKVQ